MTYDEAHSKDLEISRRDYSEFLDLPPLAACRCGGEARIDISMALIACDKCGISFEYRYNQGVIPYHTWQKSAGAIG